MTIFFIRESWGIYEDAGERILKAFSSKKSAECFCEQYNASLKANIQKENKCNHCNFCHNHNKPKTIKAKQEFIERAQKYCMEAEFYIDEMSERMLCNCRYLGWDLNTKKVEIIEIELE